MISKIISGDIFRNSLQVGEGIVNIACGTNVNGFNDTQGNSVAGKIGKNYAPEFGNLGYADLGYVHQRNFQLGNINARALGIVCNGQLPGTWHSENESDWSRAVEAIGRGFDKIETIVSPANFADIESDSLEAITKILSKDSSSSIADIEKEIDTYKAKILPIVRTVLIGSGDSGRNNDANVAGILQAMQVSPANLHLYLHDTQQQAQVAKVIPLFPNIGALAAVDGYEDIRRVA